MRRLLLALGMALAMLSAAQAEGPATAKVGIYRVVVTVVPNPPRQGTAHVVADITRPAYQGGHLVRQPCRGLQVNARLENVDSPMAEGDAGRYQGDIHLTRSGTVKLMVAMSGPDGSGQMIVPLTVLDGTSPTPPKASTQPPTATVTSTPTVTLLSTHPGVGGNTFRLRVTDGGIPMDGVTVTAALTMPGMAMVVPPRQARPTSSGGYAVAARLQMSGPWTLTVDVTRATTLLTRQAFHLTVAAAFSHHWPSLALLAIILGGAGVGGWQLRGGTTSARYLLVCLTCLTVPLLAGELIYARVPDDPSMGMPMNMSAPDMGLSMADMAAPAPVLVQRIDARPLVTTIDSEATLLPARETAVTAGRPTVLRSWLVQPGDSVRLGQSLAVLGDVQLRAPSAGLVSALLAETGQSLRPDTAVARLAQDDKLRYQARLTAADAARLRVGAEAYLITRAGKRILTRVSSVSALIDADTQTVGVSGVVPNGDRLLQVGEQVRLRFVSGRHEKAIVVPSAAVFSWSQQPTVWRVDDVAGQLVVRRQGVQIESETEDGIEIMSGLSAGDRIVASHTDPLEEGMVVAEGAYGNGPYRNLLLPKTL